MKARLLLSGILLLSVVTACSDRNEEMEVARSADHKKIEVGAGRSEAARVVSDSLKKQTILNEATNKQGDTESYSEAADTIDPTKSDRPK
ncbi:hypothetical protein H3Z85_08650 [Chryseobacterium indologenes]|uniref:Uncharacterized protein n=1 Tax=Chryseobacterium indologenes TaxID=253 RepID=A0A1Z3W6Z7_CHRID|nr:MULTISPECIES: hypothetical protein [Chryseobacterium]ASE63474.1 hypothetical protein CEQ15_19315 [Chryseobacterium indologenes]ATN07469.1 hypothetical protein CRN76_19755 [Chryseobacterium indologenes]AYY83793.1 hypothetical protein EGX91_04070 [Chryseobacterium indologenes]AYZ37611.1 hypothetical protein EGY07_19720 [Chryseobacterium indologenes]AZB19188.1 hypothetical protein EG352_16105 [Chryseobacterium indologenes]